VNFCKHPQPSPMEEDDLIIGQALESLTNLLIG
jgi:hypothetical protein